MYADTSKTKLHFLRSNTKVATHWTFDISMHIPGYEMLIWAAKNLKRMRIFEQKNQNPEAQGDSKMTNYFHVSIVCLAPLLPLQLKMNVTHWGLMVVNTFATRDRNPTCAAVLRGINWTRTTNRASRMVSSPSDEKWEKVVSLFLQFPSTCPPPSL